MKIILASASPRRRELLAELGCRFEIITADIDENIPEKDPAVHVCILAERKAMAVREKAGDDALIIAADTVVCADGEILGKPCDRADAERMLRMLSGRRHEVISGIAVGINGRVHTAYESTAVTFKRLSDREISAYLNTNEPYDKAGAYAVQGIASLFIERIEGDYFNVVGLPRHRLYELLCKLGISASEVFTLLGV